MLDSAAKGEFVNSQRVWLFPFSLPTIMLASLNFFLLGKIIVLLMNIKTAMEID